MPKINSIILSILLLTSPPGLALESESLHPPSAIEKLLAILPGTWQGRAIETPAGLLDYNITFHTCTQTLVAGVAELQSSDHYWQFHHTAGDLTLTFMSTFDGNRDPVNLAVGSASGGTIHFHAPQQPLLTLAVSVNDAGIDIRVFHHHKLHVHIRLTSKITTAPIPDTSESALKSCQSLR